MQRIPAPFGGEVTEAVFAGNDIYALAITDLGLGLFEWNGEWKRVIAEQAAGIEDLRCGEFESGEKVLHFVSDIDGVRNVYMLNLLFFFIHKLDNYLVYLQLPLLQSVL